MFTGLGAQAPLFLSVLRIVSALVFMAHGIQKLFGYPAGEHGPVENWLSFPMGIAGILETFGGGLLLIGLCTRPVAFILSGMMAVAYWMAHAPQAPLPIQNGGDGAILFCFIFLYIFFAGPGSLAADNLFAKKPAKA